MNTKFSLVQIIRSTIALGLAGVMSVGSIVTVAAAAASTPNDVQTVENENENTSSAFTLHNVSVTVDGKNFTAFALNQSKVKDFLSYYKIELGDNKLCNVALSSTIESDTDIIIYDAKKIKVTADGETKDVLLPYGNIVDGLNFTGYNIGSDDILSISREKNVEDIDEVTIQRVTYKDTTATEEIKFEKVKKNSDELELGRQEVKTEGKGGEKKVTTRHKLVDGKEVSSEVIAEKVTKEAVDEVTLFGTKGSSLENIAGTFTDSNGNTVAYSKVVSGSGTAYTAPSGALTATGAPAQHGGVAVNPNIIPYGSKVYVVSTDGSFVYGYATAIDTGGALMDGSAIVDCFYSSLDECYSFGRRDVNVYIVG